MDQSDLDPDPRRQAPTLLWVILGFVLIVAFAALVVALVGHVPPRSIGPPPGSPD